MILSLVTSILKSIELYLALKNKKFYIDMYESQRKREVEFINTIEQLRARGTIESTREADLLFKQFEYERNGWEKIQKIYENSTK